MEEKTLGHEWNEVNETRKRILQLRLLSDDSIMIAQYTIILAQLELASQHIVSKMSNS